MELCRLKLCRIEISNRIGTSSLFPSFISIEWPLLKFKAYKCKWALSEHANIISRNSRSLDILNENGKEANSVKIDGKEKNKLKLLNAYRVFEQVFALDEKPIEK